MDQHALSLQCQLPLALPMDLIECCPYMLWYVIVQLFCQTQIPYRHLFFGIPFDVGLQEESFQDLQFRFSIMSQSEHMRELLIGS